MNAKGKTAAASLKTSLETLETPDKGNAIKLDVKKNAIKLDVGEVIIKD